MSQRNTPDVHACSVPRNPLGRRADARGLVIARAAVASLLLAACAGAVGQVTPCPADPLDTDGGVIASRAPPCERRPEGVGGREGAPERAVERAAREGDGDADRNPAQPRVITPAGAVMKKLLPSSPDPDVVTPPGAIMKKVLPPDPNKEERMLRERIHRALRKNDRGKLSTSPECQAIVQQIGEQQPLLHSLRSETRSQARERTNVLSAAFRDHEC